MAEFVEVIQKKDEICKYYGTSCAGCPLNKSNNSYGIGCPYFMCQHPEEAEKIIMDWQKPVDWSKVEVDTPILVRREETSDWISRHFSRYENGRVFAWMDGRTSFTAERYQISEWKYAKLAKEGE